MKRKLLSLLLLLAMLITAVPVMVAAEEAAEPAQQAVSPQAEAGDLHDWYVQDGLTALHSTFGANNGVDLTNGTWANRVENGASATLKGTLWTANAGGIGYRLAYGVFYAQAANSSIVLPNSYAELDNFTVETLANVVGITNEDGSRYVNIYTAASKDEEGNVIPASGAQYGVFKSGISNFRFDMLTSFFFASYDPRPSTALVNRWYLMNAAYSGSSPDTKDDDNGYTALDFVGTDNGWSVSDAATYKLNTMQVTRTTDDAATETYVLGYNNVAKVTKTMTAEQRANLEAKQSKEANRFQLFAGMPADVYSIRVYNRALTDVDKLQNHKVDLLLYYDIAVPAALVADAKAQTAILDAIGSLDFETDAVAKAAAKAELEEIVEYTEKVLAARSLDGTLYVTEGLTALFSAFDSNVAYTVEASGSNKIWYNQVEGAANATFKGSIWTIGANGGVGKTYIRGTMTDGVFDTTNANNTPWGKTPLHFGLDLLPDEDFTVEYLAYFPPIYAEDTATGELVAHYTAGYTESYHIVDMYGFLEFDTVYPGGKFDSMNNYLRGRVGDAGMTAWGGTAGGGTYGFGSVNFKIDKRDTLTVDTHGLYRDETVTVDPETGEETEVKASYGTLYNTTVRHKLTDFSTAYTTHGGSYVSSTEMKNGKYYFGDDTGRDFYLSNTAGATFYTVRIYDRVLTADEREQNRMADVLNYYSIELTAEQKANEKLMAYLTDTALATTLEQDASAYAAAKAAFVTAIADFSKYQTYETIIDTMYVQDGLTANYTTFLPGQYDLSAGTWTDRVAGKTASLDTKARWSAGEFGGIGFTSFYGAFDEAGAYTGSVASNNHNVSVKLNFGIEQLPEEDYTIEYIAMYKPLYVYDADEADHIARDAAGNKIETFSQDPATTGLFIDKGNVDNLGWFQSIMASVDGQIYSGWKGTTTPEETRGAAYWVFGHNNGNDSAWYADSSGRQGWWLGAGRTAAGGLHKLGDAYNTNNAIRAYAISVDETTEAGVTTALFSLYRDGVLYNSNAAVNDINTSAKGIADGGYYPADTAFDSTCRFWLANKRPVDFFAVRIYDRVLTDAEKNMNHMLDLIMFYEIEAPMELLADESLANELAWLLTPVSFTTDAVAGAANAQLIKDVIEEFGRTNKVYSLYVQEGLVANFTALTAKDMMASIDSGTWANRVAGGAAASMGNKQFWHKNANGSVGFNIFYGGVDSDGNYNTDSSYNNYATLGTRLEFGIGLLPKDDFTVEMVAQINPVYAADAEGNPAGEAYLLNGNTPGSQQYGAHATTPIHQLGYFQAWTTNRDGVHGGFSARAAWVWTASTGTDWETANQWHGMYGAHGQGVDGAKFPVIGEVHTYAFIREEGMADIADKNGEVQNVYNAEYTLRRDTVTFASQSFNAVFQAEKTGAAYTSMPDFTKDDTGYFYLSERISTDFYAVRVYNRVLSLAEMQGNHLVDIILYYGLTFDEKLYDDADLFSETATSLAEAQIVTDASAYAANRALYQEKLNKKEINVSIGGEDKVLEVYGNKLTLPEIYDGKVALAWTVDGVDGVMTPGTIVDVTDGMTVTPTLFARPETATSVSVKITEKESDLGVRFTASFSRAEYVELAKLYGQSYVKFGMLITPDAYVQMAGGVFTRDALNAMVLNKASASGAAYIDIEARAFYTVEDEVLTLAGSVNSFKETTYKKNPAFAAVAYIDIDTDKDGIYDFTIYGNYNPAASTTVTAAMNRALSNATNTQKGWIDSLLSRFGA